MDTGYHFKQCIHNKQYLYTLSVFCKKKKHFRNLVYSLGSVDVYMLTRWFFFKKARGFASRPNKAIPPCKTLELFFLLKKRNPKC